MIMVVDRKQLHKVSNSDLAALDQLKEEEKEEHQC